jgi:Cof subfamily protein (haloacid dehalogenase superfamily)
VSAGTNEETNDRQYGRPYKLNTSSNHGLPDIRDGLPIDWMPQLVAIDVDDTLTTWLGSVRPEVTEAVKRAQDAGVIVTLATGRSVSTTVPVARSAGIHDLIVCSNGAILADSRSEKVVEAVTFDPQPLVEQLIEIVPDAVFAVEDLHGEFRTTHYFEAGALGLSLEVAPLEEILAEPVTRLVVRSEGHAEEGFAKVAEHLGFHSVVFGVADVAWMDVGPKGVNKSTMLTELCARHGVDPSRTVTIGDYINDIEMLKWAGLGVVMGHAPDSVRQHANAVTDPEPGIGVAQVLNAIADTR